jgi:hypothetical protein
MGDADLDISLPPETKICLTKEGAITERRPTRDEVDATVDAIFDCAELNAIGVALTAVIADNLEGLVSDEGLACLAAGLANKDAARSLLIFALDDATDRERLPVAELVGDCV